MNNDIKEAISKWQEIKGLIPSRDCKKEDFMGVLAIVLIKTKIVDRSKYDALQELLNDYPASPEAMKGLRDWNGESGGKQKKAMALASLKDIL